MPELTENAKTAFIILVGSFIVILLIVTYYIYFDNKLNEELNNNLKELNEEIKNNSNNVNNSNNSNNLNNTNNVNNSNTLNNSNNLGNNEILETEVSELPEENNEEIEEQESNMLLNIKDGSYKNKKDPQVYNLSNNIYSYDDARAACMAHGGKLATHQQVIDAYKKGANWCNYGWTENQTAYFPVQKKEWEKLQLDPESANNCGGNWGVNGGYFENKHTMLGANCYGIKPEPKDRERGKPAPISKRERDILLRVQRFKNEMKDLTVSPFNSNLWSEP